MSNLVRSNPSKGQMFSTVSRSQFDPWIQDKMEDDYKMQDLPPRIESKIQPKPKYLFLSNGI